ncbi:MAG: hypothetical protein HWN68_20960, partial [Desulfobacterales bacterium]|nr:hypothetical protein [Desulfobacterales bacterium]
KKLTNKEIECIAKLTVEDLKKPGYVESVAAAARAKILQARHDPDSFKDRHLLMSLVLIRATKETGNKKFRQDDIVSMYNRAVDQIQEISAKKRED